MTRAALLFLSTELVYWMKWFKNKIKIKMVVTPIEGVAFVAETGTSRIDPLTQLPFLRKNQPRNWDPGESHCHTVV